MAIVKLKPDAVVSEQPRVPESIEAPAESIFTSLVPENRLKGLLKYVEGYPWTVDYYGMLLNNANTLESFDPGLLDINQSFYKVNKAIIQVTSPLSTSYEEEIGTIKADGSAIVPMGIRPNVGDVFHSQIDDGEDALFVVTSSTRKSHRKESVYEINYSLYAYTSDQPEFLSKLNKRVQDEYFFNPDTNYFNRDVLVSPKEHEVRKILERFLRESESYYFDTFSQDYNSSLMLPGLSKCVYDPLLADFIMSTVDVSEVDNVKFYKHTLESKDLRRPSILSCLLTKTEPHLRVAEEKYKFCDARSLPIRSRLGTLSYTGVDYVLYPEDPLRDFITPHTDNRAIYYAGEVKNDRNYSENMFTISLTSNSDGSLSKDVLHELFEDDFYIVSENFYKYIEDKEYHEDISFTELLIYKFLFKKAIPKEDLVIALDEWKSWSLLHQFYLLPVYWLIIRNS